MSDEFKTLQYLIKKGEFDLILKRSITRNNIFGVWLYWYCKTKPSVINIFGTSFYIYYIFSNDWLWLALSVIIGYKFGWMLGLLTWAIHYFIQKHVFDGIGQGFMLYDAQTNEELFDELWQNQSIGIVSVRKHKSPIHREGVPDMFIDSRSHDWKKELNKLDFLKCFNEQSSNQRMEYLLDISQKKLEKLNINNDLPNWMVSELDVAKDIYKKNTSNRLYLIKFNKRLTTDQAEKELSLLGLQPANIIEIALFINTYSNIISERPIIALNAYHDYSKTFKELIKSYRRPPKYDLCICFTSEGFETPAEIESAEAFMGAVFSVGTSFLAKFEQSSKQHKMPTSEHWAQQLADNLNRNVKNNVDVL